MDMKKLQTPANDLDPAILPERPRKQPKDGGGGDDDDKKRVYAHKRGAARQLSRG